MKKKSFNWLSYLPVVTLGMGLLIGGVRFQLQAEQTKEKVIKLESDTKTEIDKVKTDIKEIATEGDKEIGKIKEENKKDITELKKENAELDKAVVAQTVKLENIQQLLEKIDQKLEKKR